MRKVIPFVIVLLLCSIPVCAHQGKTDSKGGHYDRQNGGYHYHHGYPAHEHTNGECPYDYDTQTQESEKEPSEEIQSQNGITNSDKQPSETTENSSNIKWKITSFLLTVLRFLLFFAAFYGITFIIVFLFISRKEIKHFFEKVWQKNKKT